TRLQGDWSSDVCSSDLSPAMGLAAAQKWLAYLNQWIDDVPRVPGRWHKAPVMMEALDAVLDPIEARMESWAAFVAIDEAYEEARSEERRVGKGRRPQGS